MVKALETSRFAAIHGQQHAREVAGGLRSQGPGRVTDVGELAELAHRGAAHGTAAAIRGQIHRHAAPFGFDKARDDGINPHALS